MSSACWPLSLRLFACCLLQRLQESVWSMTHLCRSCASTQAILERADKSLMEDILHLCTLHSVLKNISTGWSITEAEVQGFHAPFYSCGLEGAFLPTLELLGPMQHLAHCPLISMYAVLSP
ncbi:unnamed protein product [Choristocarpus tenellus]